MKPADLREGDHLTHHGRLDGTRVGAVVVERLMSPGFVVVGHVVAKNAAEMLLVQDDDVVEALATYGTDQPLAAGILPRGSWCCLDLFDTP